MLGVILFSTLVLTACASLRPTPVPVTRLVYVQVPADLTATKPIPEPRNDSGRELLRIARQRKADLQVCYADKTAIGSIQGTKVP